MGFQRWTGLAILWMAMAGGAAAGDTAELKKQVWETEKAFAATMKARDLKAFSGFLADETVFFSGPKPIHGKEGVIGWWTKYYDKPEAPFSWEPDEVEVLDSGTLAISGGPVYDAKGKLFARFSSIWRQKSPGKWEIIFDRGWEVCDCKKP
jgi:ketosteroid isomerase-like protein